MINIPDNQGITIFGASGDLTERKLIPALYDLYLQQLMPEDFFILGVGRKKYGDDSFRDKMSKGIKTYMKEENGHSEKKLDRFLQHIYYISINTKESSDYQKLKERIDDLDQKHQTGNHFLYYLATPPSMYEIIARNLGHHHLNKPHGDKQWKRLIVEKPFGYDLESGKTLNKALHKHFNEEQIYRIDHYLGKETVQNILVTRFSNVIFEPIWNHHFIDHIEITAAENIGVENRGEYYDQSGALRDMVQNHLLQLVGFVAMEPPALSDGHAIRNETLKVFQSLRPLSSEDIQNHVIRGQYIQSRIKGQEVKSYREEEGVDSNSKTETFIAMKFFIDNWRWSGVPFYIRTGKHLPTRVTEIVIHFKQTPHHLFCRNTSVANTPNQLILRIQPDEGILLNYGMKVPGAGFNVQNVGMDFHYSELSDTRLPSAYERLLLDCMHGDSTLYARGDALEATWKFISPILDEWKNNPDIKIYGYPAGSWGPDIVDELMEADTSWRYPCKNLVNQGEYCEL